MDKQIKTEIMTKHLDLGCGSSPRNPYDANEIHIIDIQKPSKLKPGLIFTKANLSLEKIPYEDNCFDYVSAYDFIEHIPRVLNKEKNTIFPFIELMNEIYRVLKPDGIFYAQTPAYPSLEAFQDPTHVNFITIKTHKYFCGEMPRGSMYGFKGKFKAISVKWVCGADLVKDKSIFKRIENFILKLTRLRKNTHLIWVLKVMKD
jgi:SAM-dependent methyltransferase